MSLIVDTLSVAPRERFAMWADAAQHTFEPMVVRADDDRPFRGRVWRYDVGPLTVSRLAADRSTVERTPATIRAVDHERFELALQLRGRSVASQEDRAGVLVPGAISSWHSSKPYRIDAETPFELLLVYCPNALLQPHIDRLCRSTALTVPATTGVARMLGDLLSGVLAGLEDGSVDSADLHIADSVLSLIRAVFLDRLNRPDDRLASSTVLRARIKAYIDAHLGDPGLRPEPIARAHFVSRSYLDKLFEAEEQSVCGWIRARRLARCRRDLIDPALAHETIARIADQWGFTNAASFTRVFKAAYGESPRELRRRLNAPQS
jgi:AraC-like DNA-binding protein